MKSAVHRRILFIGDLNCNPFTQKSPGATALQELSEDGFQIPDPEGEWSYISIDGKKHSRIDHAVLSPYLKCKNCRYLTRQNGIVLAGPKSQNPISDHAMLVVEIGGVSGSNLDL